MNEMSGFDCSLGPFRSLLSFSFFFAPAFRSSKKFTDVVVACAFYGSLALLGWLRG